MRQRANFPWNRVHPSQNDATRVTEKEKKIGTYLTSRRCSRSRLFAFIRQLQQQLQLHVLPSFLPSRRHFCSFPFSLCASPAAPFLSFVNTEDAVTRTAVTHRDTPKLFFKTGTPDDFVRVPYPHRLNLAHGVTSRALTNTHCKGTRRVRRVVSQE